jgi:deoxyribodipyrimidine photo-lyase
MTIALYWFRNDLRLSDNPAFLRACKEVDYLLPIYIREPHLDQETSWGFKRVGRFRQVFLRQSLEDLRGQLRELGSDLIEVNGSANEVFEKLTKQIGASAIYCEQIEAPEELGQVVSLSNSGLQVNTIWQSSMLDPQSLPFSPQEMPDIFTQFRQQVEKKKLRFTDPIQTPQKVPPLPIYDLSFFALNGQDDVLRDGIFQGGERCANSHIKQYFERRLPDTYKQTRNQLIGLDYSSKFSPWLASGCCSARSIAKQLSEYESEHGANEGTYWLWFELLWRDYFRFLHFKFGNQLYRSAGLSITLSNASSPDFDETLFKKWASGNTGESFIDAGMRELSKTGFLSNRMRQVVASYWIYDMQGDWQVGAAWFESQLVDYDVYSNQGNWLYIAGKGTDPRGGRAFNVRKQAQDHDPEGAYQHMWLA